MITVTKPEPTQTEETNLDRGKTFPRPPTAPVLETGRALANFEGTRTSGTEEVTDSCLRVQMHTSPSKLYPLVKPLGSILSGVPLTPIHIVQLLPASLDNHSYIKDPMQQEKSWQQVRAAVKLQCSHLGSTPMARTTK